MARLRSLSIALAAALLLAGFASAWHGADHAHLEAHQELCGVCSLTAQLGNGLSPDVDHRFEAIRVLEIFEAPRLLLSSAVCPAFLARGPPMNLA